VILQSSDCNKNVLNVLSQNFSATVTVTGLRYSCTECA